MMKLINNESQIIHNLAEINKVIMKRLILLASGAIVLAGCSQSDKIKWTETKTEYGHNIITQNGGQTLGYNPESGVKILTVDGYAFKDLNRNGKLDPYEDWRLSAEERAEDLAAMGVDFITTNILEAK